MDQYKSNHHNMIQNIEIPTWQTHPAILPKITTKTIFTTFNMLHKSRKVTQKWGRKRDRH